MPDISKAKIKGIGYDIKDEKARESGKSPYIGENGNWYVWDDGAGEYVDSGVSAGGNGGVTIDDTLTQSGQAADAKAAGDAIDALSQQKVDADKLSLGFGPDGKLYIMISGIAVGNGIEISGSVIPADGIVVFAADLSGNSPLDTQFYAWEGRVYGTAIYDELGNILCQDGVAHLTSVYDVANSRWIKQMMCTGGLFESDNFTCTFRAKFSGLAGSWQNVITYGTGTHWTNGTYSDGVKWPAGGEIDAFEQAGAYSETPNTFKTPTAHYGSGSNSGYPDTHLSDVGAAVQFTTDEWHDFKFSLKNGVVTVYIDGEQVGQSDFSGHAVSNNYFYNYYPFLKPQAIYLDGSCASDSANIDKSNTYDFQVSDFRILQEQNVACNGLEIYPQMWAKGTELVFPVGAELYLDRTYTPANTSNKACNWVSSDPSVATVCQGYVKTLKAGTTTITATCGAVSASYALKVSETANIPCAGIALSTDNVITGDSGYTVTAYTYPQFTTDSVIWESSDSAVCTVENGVITGVGTGNAIVTATCGSASKRMEVTVSVDKFPWVSYDFTVLAQYINTLVDENNENVVVYNTGTGGNQFDVSLTAVKKYYDANGENYNASGYVETYKGQTSALDETINFKSQPLTFVYCLANASSNGRQYINGPNANIMPSLEGVILRFGYVTMHTLTLTGNDRIVVYSDGTNAYAYQNGELIASGTATYITTAFSYFYFQSLTGTNMEKLDVYIGKTFTEAELIAMSTPLPKD